MSAAIAPDILQTGGTSIKWWKWFTETSQIISAACPETQQSILLSEPYYKPSCSFAHQEHTYTYNMPHTLFAIFLFVLEPVHKTALI